MKNHMTLWLLSIVLLIAQSAAYLQAQSCCTAGTPLLSSLELPSSPVGGWQLAMTYDDNIMNDLISGERSFGDASTERRTRALLTEFNYGLTKQLSLGSLFSIIQHERYDNAARQSTSAPSARTRGISDAVILFKYTLIPLTLPTQSTLAVGVGAKIPLGASDLTSQGILLPADFQPGTGAWDLILWGYASRGYLPHAPLTLFLLGSYRSTGTNARYGSSQEGYSFGSELITSLGASYTALEPVALTLLLRFRHTRADRFANNPLPSTGGLWLTAAPGITLRISETIATRGNIHLPFYRRVEGTQLTTSYNFSFSFFYNFSPIEQGDP
jgi:hypothetical protein